MGDIPSYLNEKEFFYGYLSEQLGESVPNEYNDLHTSLLEKEEYQKALAEFREKKGLLQLELQNFILTANDLSDLNNKMQPKEVTESVEAIKIQEVARREKFLQNIQSFVILLISLGVCFSLWKVFSPKEHDNFHPLEALTYEALNMGGQDEEEYLNFPTTESNDIFNYLNTHKGLDFTPLSFKKPLSIKWQPAGASIIDYDIAKIALIKFKNKIDDQQAFLFSFKGQMNDLARSEPVTSGDFTYYPYSSNEINLIAWQEDEKTTAFFAGWLGIEKLAQLAKKGLAIE